MSSNMKILVADDNRDHIQLMGEILKEELGAEIESATTGEECLKKVDKDSYDLLLLDYLFPKINGLDILKTITDKHSDLPVIMVTGHGDEKIAVEAMKTGAIDYIVKSEDGFAALPSAAKKAIEKSQLKKGLRESEEKYRTLVETAQEGISITDLDENMTFTNQAFADLLGYTKEELLGLNLSQISDKEGFAKFRKETKKRQRGQSSKYEIKLYTKAGEVKYFSVSATPLSDYKGTVTGTLGLLDDITERKRAEEALRESEEKYRDLIENINDFVYTLDLNGNFTSANKIAFETFGYTSDDLYKTNFIDLLPEKYQAQALKDFQTILKHGEIRNAVAVIKSKEGKEVWLEFNSTAIVKDGKVVGTRGVARDITERKRAEELLRESEKLAATGRIAARIAHEINNPLGGIKNSFLLIKDAIPKDHPYYQYVGRIEKEIDRIAHIVHQMFDLYRQDREPTKQFSVDETIRDVVALLESSCRERQVNIEIDTGEAPVVDTMPEGSLRQVLFNVIQNAIEASPPGKMVKVTAGASKNFFTLTVSDQGKGIPEKIRSHIFEPFFTTKSAEVTGGLGLGLSVSKSLVEAMGGSLDFESKTGKGTKFSIVLPMERLKKEEQNG